MMRFFVTPELTKGDFYVNVKSKQYNLMEVLI